LVSRTKRLSTPGSRTTTEAQLENPSTWRRHEHLDRFPWSPNSDFRCWLSAGSSLSREGNQIGRNSSRPHSPANSSARGSSPLSPTQARRLTGSDSSLSWQRSLRPPPASLGDRVYRRELHSASGAPPSVNAPRSTGVPSGRCCRLLRDRGDEQGRSPVDDRSRLGFRHSVVGVAAGRQYRPGMSQRCQRPVRAPGVLGQRSRVPRAAS
jgi:hypothetical protein